MTKPRYQDVRGSDIPELLEDDGTVVKVIVGSFWGKTGPVDGIAADPQYLDIYVPPNKKRSFKVDTRRAAFAYVFEGAAKFDDSAAPRGVLTEKEFQGQELNIRDMSGNRTLVEFGKGDEVVVRAGEDGVRFLLISGAPIAEPVAWHGPIVMNTQEELMQAMRELRNGTFIKPSH
jgi:redox-sensitive bicupin YhaK (pirin superfamily)